MPKYTVHPFVILALGLLAAGCGPAPNDVRAGEEDTTRTTSEALRVALPSKTLRIAVVGAGPSGLTAAQTLKELGYKNVTVFEKNDRVGGKVYSYRSGSTVTELGAVFASPDYKLVLGLADKYGIPYVDYSNGQRIVDETGKPQSAEEFLRSRYSTLEILGATASYAGTLALFAPTQENGLALLPPEGDLYLPFGEFAKKYGIAPIAELARSVMVGFGYGYYETTPAIYYMKLLSWLVKLSPTKGLDQATYYTFPTGFQSIWEAVARDLDVHLKSEVTSIERPSPSGAPVRITVGGTERRDFDEVVVSAPLNKVSSFMTLTNEERELFSQVESERYDVSIFQATGLATEDADFFHGNAKPERINHVNAWANRSAGSPFEAWQIADWAASPDEITRTLAADVASQGGQFAGLLLRQDWDYFPHVGTTALRNAFYYKMEARQGNHHTFYVGSTLSFETVEHSARYAQQLVRTHFLPPFLP
jgi:predicted NAD/FAD-dependent oxidoreductase